MSDFVPEVAYVGQTLELIGDTSYANLAALNTRQIRYQQNGRAQVELDAEVVDGEPTKLSATMPSEDNDLKCHLRVWTYARGSGTIVFIGTARKIRILDEGEA
jgi:hypothetical protein